MRAIRVSELKKLLSHLVLAVVFSLSSTATVTAADYSFTEPPEITNREKAHLNIIFTGGGADATCEVDTATVSSSSGNNAKVAFEFFVSKGFNEKQAAGILGNYLWESGMNPKRVQGSGEQESETLPETGGYGIAQWDDRKPLLKKFSEEIDPKNRPIYDLGLQLDFTIWELKNTETAAYDAFKKTTTIRDATMVWMKDYERPGEEHFDKRLALANKSFGDYSTGTSPGGNTDPLSSLPTEPASSAECDPSSAAGSGDIVAIALQELKKGVIEKPIGCDAGNPSVPGDCGAEVNKYTDSTLEYWCADFVSWVYKTAGKPFKGGASGGWRLPSVEGIQAYMERSGTFHPGKPSSPDPKPGDVYVIDNGVHIGIVIKVEGNKLYTVSGNTSTENFSNGVGVGDRVYTNFKNDPSITGWGGLR